VKVFIVAQERREGQERDVAQDVVQDEEQRSSS
jgi:hypothetical protein